MTMTIRLSALSRTLMAVPVVNIREVRVRVDQWFVPVPMAMFGAGRHLIVMRVQVVFVVEMLVTVFHRFVHMSVLMALG